VPFSDNFQTPDLSDVREFSLEIPAFYLRKIVAKLWIFTKQTRQKASKIIKNHREFAITRFHLVLFFTVLFLVFYERSSI